MCSAVPINWLHDKQYFKGNIRVTSVNQSKAGHPVDELLMLELMLGPLSPSTKLPLLKSAHFFICMFPLMNPNSHDRYEENKPRSGLLRTLTTIIQPFNLAPLWTAERKGRCFRKLVTIILCPYKPAEPLQSNSRPILTQLVVHLSQKTQARKYVPHTVTLKIGKKFQSEHRVRCNTTCTCQWHPSMPSFFVVSSSKLPIHEVCFEVVGLRQNRFGMDAQIICETTPDVSLAGLKCPPPHPTLTPFSQ